MDCHIKPLKLVLPAPTPPSAFPMSHLSRRQIPGAVLYCAYPPTQTSSIRRFFFFEISLIVWLFFCFCLIGFSIIFFITRNHSGREAHWNNTYIHNGSGFFLFFMTELMSCACRNLCASIFMYLFIYILVSKESFSSEYLFNMYVYLYTFKWSKDLISFSIRLSTSVSSFPSFSSLFLW